MNKARPLHSIIKSGCSLHLQGGETRKLTEYRGIENLYPHDISINRRNNVKLEVWRFLFNLMLCLVVILSSQTSLKSQTKDQNKTLGYGTASYTGISDNEFLKSWMILGPDSVNAAGVRLNVENQKAFFDKDVFTNVTVDPKKVLANVKIGNVGYAWKLVNSEEGTVDLSKLLGQVNFAVAYALAEIRTDAPAKILIGVGSDDGVKIFVNGNLVHSNWIGRPLAHDDDIVSVELKKGSNQILVKIQNMEYDWSFSVRKLGADLLSKAFVESAGKGNLDNLKLLAENGTDVNGIGGGGLTAYQMAQVKGRATAMNYLKEMGAKTDLPMPSFDQLVSNIFQSAQTGVTSGASVLVSKDGKILYEKGFGYADIGNKVPVTPDTKFRIGSITKQFTAAAILKLQEEGKLNVQDKLSKFIPDFPRGDEVTIHHLLTHTSGIHSYTNNPYFLKYVTSSVTPKALVDTIKSKPYDFNPGDRYMYNNSGFFLLGYIIEQISGKSYGEYLNDTFFKPLGMHNTGVYQSNLLLNNEAYGYSSEKGNKIKALNWDMSWAGGAGSLYSTVRDLNTWNEAVFNGKVLSEESLKAAFTPVVLNNKEKVDYGYGWAFQNYRGSKFISHGGGLHGFVSFLERQPESKVNVAVLCNSTPPPDGINPSSNAMSIAEYLLWQNMEKQSSFSSDLAIDEDILKSYTGRYDYGQGAVLIVTLEGNQLNAQLTGQPKYPIYPSSKNEFNWKVAEAKVRFVTGENGEVTHAIHNQGGREIKALKLKDEIAVEVDPAIFEKYAGKYDFGNQSVITIEKVGDKLMLMGMSLSGYQLLPASKTEFFTREMSVRFTFTVDDEGNANSLVLNNSGALMTANRVKD